jgi:hypothetical protein
MPEDLSASRDKFIALCRRAHIPSQYWFDKKWRRAQPSYYKTTIAYHEGEYVRLREHEQAQWLQRLATDITLLQQPHFLAFLGDHFPDLANRVAFGLLVRALLHGDRVRAFAASALSVPHGDAVDEVLASPPKYTAVLIHGAHTDDDQTRRQVIRDFVQLHDRALRLLVIHGHDPLTYLHTVLGLNPHGVFYLPTRGTIFKLGTEKL